MINFSSALAILLANLSSACCIFLSVFFPAFIFSAAFWYLLCALAISFAYAEKVLSSFWSTFWVNLTDCSTVFSACFATLSAALSALSAALSAAFSALSAALSAAFSAAFSSLLSFFAKAIDPNSSIPVILLTTILLVTEYEKMLAKDNIKVL